MSYVLGMVATSFMLMWANDLRFTNSR